MEKRKMSLKEAERLSVTCNKSLRHTKRLRKRYCLEEAEGLIFKHVDKVSPNRTDPKVQADVLKVLHMEEYAGFGPTFARDKIEERQ
ncbi:MAG: hypothetical protein AB7H48_12905 [Parachlamydiales bacterium]